MPQRSASVLLVNLAVVLALLVVMLGGWTRINDAGLGCPDWPGCYGHIVLPGSEQALAQAQALYPDQLLVAGKGWLEMVHRYAASSLGLLVLLLAWLGWKRRAESSYPVGLGIVLLILVCVQGAFGMWTVTLKLLPIVVTLHLLGGLAILSLLVLLRFRVLRWHRAAQWPDVSQTVAVRRRQGKGWVMLATAVLFGQIALGGWTSANYAGWACTDWLQCEQGGAVSLDFAAGFTPALETGPNYQGGHMPREARAAVQMTHRAGAVAVLILIALMIWRLGRSGWPRPALVTVALLVVVQIGLGIANIIYAVPIPLAMAHHGGAVVLLLSLVWLSQQDLVVDKETVYACAQSC